MTTYNNIGISDELDWPRIRHLMRLGIVAALMVLAGDMMLGWGVADPAQTGLAAKMSTYLHLSDAGIFWSAFLGFIGIPLEALCYFSVYRLIAPASPRYAHLYRTGILGYLAFAGCGVHVPCLACVYLYKHLLPLDAAAAETLTLRFGLYFLLPGTIILLVFMALHTWAHIAAFSKGLTPYPRKFWIFCPQVGMAAVILLRLLPETALRNALTAGWISLGNLWMFGGLLVGSRKMGKGK